MKKMILLSSVLAVALTGCVVDPWDEGYRGHHDHRNGHYDRDRGDKDWKKHRDHRDWKRDRGDRDWRRNR